MAQSPVSFLVDPSATPSSGNPAPATNRPGTALYTSSSQPQGGILNLGSDYASTASAQAMKTDAYGNQYVVASTPAGTAAVVAQAAAPASTYYGSPIMARQDAPTPSNWQSLTADPLSALNVHAKSKVTVKYILPTTVGGSSKSMLSLLNGSSASIVRIQQIHMITPLLIQTGASVAGLSGTYSQSVLQLHELRRITGQTKGSSTTVISPSMCDSADTIDSNIVVMSNATLSGAASVPWHRQDANNLNGLPWYYRTDVNAKTLVLRPGEGVSLNSITATANYSYDIELTITVASA